MDAAAASLHESVDFLRNQLPSLSLTSGASSTVGSLEGNKEPSFDDDELGSYTDPTISGFLCKRGKRTQLWKQAYYAISNGCLCELAAPPPGAARCAVSLMPVTGLDTSNRASVKRATPLVDITSCETLKAESVVVGGAAGGWARRTSSLLSSNRPGDIGESVENSGSSSSGGSGGVGAASSSRQFTVTTKARVFVFRAEQVQETLTWCEGLRLIAQRNTGTNNSETSDRVLVVVSDEDQANRRKEPPLSVYLKVGEAGGTVADLKQRLVERRGLLPPQMRLKLELSGELLEDDEAPLTALLLGERLHQRMLAAAASNGANGAASEEFDDGEEVCDRSQVQQVLRVTLGRRQLLLAPVAGPDPAAAKTSSGSSAGGGGSKVEVFNDFVSLGSKRWGFRADWQTPPFRVPALVVFHKRFPPQRNLVKLVTGTSASGGGSGAATSSPAKRQVDTDPWWREHLVMVHVTPQPIRGEAHLTLVLEGTRETLGASSCLDRSADVYERPLIYFCPKPHDVKWLLLEPALRMGFGKEGEGYEVTKDRHGRDIWVIKRPPLVTEEEITTANGSGKKSTVRVLFTYVFRNPGAAMLMPVLRCCSKFRVLFQTSSAAETPEGGDGRTEVYAKFEIQPAFVNLF